MHTNTHIHEHIWYWYTKCTLHAGCPRHEHREAGNALKTSYVLIDGARGAYECCRCCSPPSVSTRMMGIILHDQRCHTHIYTTPKWTNAYECSCCCRQQNRFWGNAAPGCNIRVCIFNITRFHFVYLFVDGFFFLLVVLPIAFFVLFSSFGTFVRYADWHS